VLFCAPGTEVVRACGVKGICQRCIPSSHRQMVETLTSHAPDGRFEPVAPYRKNSKVVDGLASSHRSEEDHQADVQRRTDENQEMASRLAEASPDNGRSFRREDADDEFDEPPFRSTDRASRYAHPPASTRSRVPGSAKGRLAGSDDEMPGSVPLSTPKSTDAGQAFTLESRFEELAHLVTASLKGQADLQERVVATQVTLDNLQAQAAFREQVNRAMTASTRTAPDVTTIDEDNDGPSGGALGPTDKSRHGAKVGDRRKKGKKGRRDKAPSTWYGVVAGPHSSIRPTLITAKAYARSYEPHGRVSSKFDRKAEAEAWVAANIDDLDSSDTASGGTDTEASGSDTDVEDVKPRARRGGLLPPGRLPTSTEPLFDLVTQDPSVGKKDELFGITIKKEYDVLKALSPKNTVKDTQKLLSECIVDGTMLPGTSSERFDTEAGGDSGDIGRMAATLSRVMREVKGPSIGGISHMVDEGFQNPARVSLRGVKNLEQLHTLDKELGQAIPNEVANMRLAFGAALDHLGWTPGQEDTYLVGGHFPYISYMIMRYYSDLVRELARRAVDGWARVKVDLTYFVKRLQSIRSHGSSRFLVMIRTYIFLRDQQHVNFESIDRMSSQMNALYAQMEASSRTPTESEGGTMCQNCKQQSLHKGGRPACPFRDLSAGHAKLAGTLAAKLCLEGSSKTAAYDAAKLRYAEDD
jgi:hypothetical protein